MPGKSWMWAAPRQIERTDGMIRFRGWKQYEPAKVPALWLRIAELETDPDGWAHAVERYGPLRDTFSDESRAEGREREPWMRTIGHLRVVSMMWKETAGVWELPSAPPVELMTAYHRLQAELTRVITDDAVKLALRGLDLVPEPVTLESFLWLSVGGDVRQRARFKRCERCTGWFPIQRTDARFCGTECRRWRDLSVPLALAVAS